MPMNLDAVGTVFRESEASWTPDDCMLYALGVGAGLDELEFVTENTAGRPLRVLPTFPVVVGMRTPAPRPGDGGGGVGVLGDFDLAQLVHGEQHVELLAPVPTAGTVRTTARVAGIYDKGSGALAVLESEAVDAETGAPRWRTTMSMFIRGEGGFGGEGGPATAAPPPPDGAPDATVSYPTRPDQALLYRLNGDRNPLHSDPTFARAAGFDRPIMHGLCTYGFSARALLHTLCGSEPDRVRAVGGRFSASCWPGDTLHVDLWRTGDGEASFRTRVDTGEVVLDRGVFRFDPA